MKRFLKLAGKAVLFLLIVALGIFAARAVSRRIWEKPPDILITDGGEQPSPLWDVSVTYIDVGQGDAALITTPDTHILIDSGEYTCADKVIRTLEEQGVKSLDMVIVSHQHTDHMGAMGEVLSRFDTKMIIMPKVPERLIPTGTSYEYMLEAAEKQGLSFTMASPCVYRLGQGMGGDISLEILYPHPDDVYDDLNDYSVVARLVYGDVSWLFTGDLTENGEKALLDSGAYVDSTVLKVGHHGSSGSSSAAFLEAVTPDVAVISVGADNSYGHPADDTVGRLHRFTDNVLRTDRAGDITLASDGRSIMKNETF